MNTNKVKSLIVYLKISILNHLKEKKPPKV